MHSSCSDGLMLCFLSVKGELSQFLQDWAARESEMAICGFDQDLECRDKDVALHLKLGAILAILLAGAAGVGLPLLGRRIKLLRSDGTFFAVAKAFAAGVILATGFVHMLPDGMESLTNECVPEYPWGKFPFSGCIAMFAALGTLMIDVLGTEYYEKKHSKTERSFEDGFPTVQPEWENIQNFSSNENVADKERNPHGDHMHVLGMHAHAASHGHSHPHGHHSCVDETHHHANGHIGHSHMHLSNSDETPSDIRHVVISQVLELGIVTHSVIIGITLGVSQSPCTIRPLMAALSFHQFFEGFALGGCISQAGFKSLSSILMACSFAVTTPSGIGIGIGISSSFNSRSPRALVLEGIFDSISAGILVYMALVDLIAADFLSKRMCCNRRLQILSYIALFLGAAAMSALAIWI